MSEPQGWQQPKTNWAAPDAPTGPDFNRIEGNAYAIENGNRTVDPAQEPVGNVGTLRQFLSWFANQIAGILGDNWWTAPAITLKAAKAHIDALIDAHDASAISYGGSANLAAANVEAALDELDTEKAGIAAANTFPAKQTFQAGIKDGDANADLSEVYALQLELHTRGVVLTYTAGRLTSVTEKDGATTIRTTTINRTGNRVSSVVEAAGGKTITTTLVYNADGTLADISKAVT